MSVLRGREAIDVVRRDERHKVIAELRELLEQPQHPEDPPVVRKIQDVLWSHTDASWRITAYAVGRHLAPLLASLLAPEGEGGVKSSAENLGQDGSESSSVAPASSSGDGRKATGATYLPSDEEIEAVCRRLDVDWYPEKDHEPAGSETWDRALDALLAAHRARLAPPSVGETRGGEGEAGTHEIAVAVVDAVPGGPPCVGDDRAGFYATAQQVLDTRLALGFVELALHDAAASSPPSGDGGRWLTADQRRAYEAGRSARINSMTRSCPFPSQQDLADAYNDGWDRANAEIATASPSSTDGDGRARGIREQYPPEVQRDLGQRFTIRWEQASGAYYVTVPMLGECGDRRLRGRLL